MTSEINYTRALFRDYYLKLQDKYKYENEELYTCSCDKSLARLIETVLNNRDYEINLYIELILSMFGAKSSDKNPMMLETWIDLNNRKAEEKYKMSGKPGKMFKKIFPFFDKITINKLAEAYKEFFEEKTLKINQVSLNRDEIRKIYTGKTGIYKSPTTTMLRKNLSTSCMRHDLDYFEGLEEGDAHPVEAYATEDFMLFYTSCDEDLIHSRCLVYMNHSKFPQAGPIYGVCEQSIDVLENYFLSQGFEIFYPDWDGAKILKIRNKRNTEYIGPYVDITSSMDESECGKYFILRTDEKEGTHETYSDSGIIGIVHIHCSICGDEHSEDDLRIIDCQYYCDYCYERYFFTCEECEETKDQDELNYLDHYTAICTDCYNEGDYVYVPSEATSFRLEDTVETEQGSIYLKSSDYEWFKSDLTGLFHDETLSIKTKCGQYIALYDEFMTDANYELNENDEWVRKKETD